MTYHLVRHASAGARHGWRGDDMARPLDDVGHRQAGQIAELLGSDGVRGVLSSPARRCVETVRPLAAACGVPVQIVPELAEGTPIHRVSALCDDGLVLCTHGDLIPALVRILLADGMVLESGHGSAKGSIWTIETAAGRPVRAAYRTTG